MAVEVGRRDAHGLGLVDLGPDLVLELLDGRMADRFLDAVPEIALRIDQAGTTGGPPPDPSGSSSTPKFSVRWTPASVCGWLLHLGRELRHPRARHHDARRGGDALLRGP